jgi:hypothetical protein
MDESRPPYLLRAFESAGSPASLRQPGPGEFPRLDDHLVDPENTRDEIIGGRRVVAMPAKPTHARQQHRLDYVIGPCVAPGYYAATDLLTRVDWESDFASDTCVLREGIDPETETRHLEEIAFEVVTRGKERDITEKADRMRRRGVRRVFAVFLKNRKFYEWDVATQSWQVMDSASRIEDPCLIAPIEVAALLNAIPPDDAVARVLVSKDNPVVRDVKAVARAEGRAAGKAEDILTILEDRGLPVDEALRSRILACADLDLLDVWFRRALRASAAEEVVGP